MTDDDGRVNGQADSHRYWEEMVAGQALGGLDVDEQSRFTEHVAGCARCAALLAAYRGTLAGLDELTDPDQRADLIRATAPDTDVVAARRGGRRRVLTALAVTASLFTVLGAGIGAVIARPSTPVAAEPNLLSQNSAVLSCLRDSACQRIPMLTSTGEVAAITLVSETSVWVVADGLDANDSQRSSYVVWQLPRDGAAPVPLVSFDSSDAAATVTAAGDPPLDVGSTSGFLISLEPRDGRLRAPTRQVAIGSLPSPPTS